MSRTTSDVGKPTFTVDISIHEWDLSAQAWLEKNEKNKELDGLATACVVFNGSSQILIIQRAAHDSMPNKWELPGGAVDPEDQTVLHGAARELFEEAGLVAKHFSHIVTEGPECPPGYVFPNSTKTKTWCRFTFGVSVEDCNNVKLDPNEHQAYVWASESDIRDQKNSERELPITRDSMRDVMLEAFRLRKKFLGTL